jgi:hypothetical protein
VQEVVSSNLIAPTIHLAPGPNRALLLGNPMRLLAPALLLILCACGGGNEEPQEAPWLPRFDTAENAVETYIRAFEGGDLELVLTATVPSEREKSGQFLSGFMRQATRDKFTWKIEYDKDNAFKGDELAYLNVTLTPVGTDGKVKATTDAQGRTIEDLTTWWAFVKQPDGTWRMSPSTSDEVARRMSAPRQPQPPENPPGNDG